MDPRARRFAIREYLSVARTALERGNRQAAIEALNAALALDPDYLAAQAMKEQVESGSAFSGEAAAPLPDVVSTPPAAAIDRPRPLISAEGWARFESRTRARRAEKRAAAARAMIARRRFDQARDTIEEIREIDPAHPEIVSLSIELDAAEHLKHRSWRWGPAAVAVVAFAASLFGARYADTPAPPVPALPTAANVAPTSRTPSGAAAVSEVSARAVAPLDTELVPAKAPVVSDAGSRVAVVLPPTPPAASSSIAGRVPAAVMPEPSGVSVGSPRSELAPLAAPVDVDPRPTTFAGSPVATGGATSAIPLAAAPRSTFAAPAVSDAVAPAQVAGPIAPPDGAATFPPERMAITPAALPAGGAAIARVPDEEGVRQTLRQYQRAYESLDAQSAQAVWPRVDGDALQRAFDGLESQSLTFERCDVQVRGAFGSAVCHGTTSYVPKVGSREPRIEPRTWTFGLRKSGDAWQIDSARTER